MDAPKKQHRSPVDVKAAATYTGFNESYLNKLRCTGGGPVFIKRAGSVRYDPDDLDAWLAALKRSSTSQEVSAGAGRRVA